VRRVIIYRNELLPASETFVLAQANALQLYTPVFAGIKRVNSGLGITAFPVVTVSSSEQVQKKLLRRIFLRTGRARGFQNAIASHSPALIHAHFATDACAVLPLAQQFRLPLVVTLHGYDVFCDDQAFRRWPATRAYLRRREALWQYASLFLCVSEHIRREAILRGFPRKKLMVHHIGVSIGCVPASACQRGPATVLFVGRLVEKKGCNYLVRAMSRIVREVSDAKLSIIGDGPLRETLEHEALPLGERVAFLGQRSHDQVKQWMRSARVLAAPSVCASNGDQEGLPTVLCEAQALGLPVVTFATDAVTEALPHNLRSVMPCERDEAGLARAIVQLIQDDAQWKRASALGRQYMEEQFDIERQTRTLEEIYDEVIANPAGRV
jgi:glycosyltransferase involved in cell wall biosynthesis